MLMVTKSQLQFHKPDPFELFNFSFEIQFQFKVNDGNLKV